MDSFNGDATFAGTMHIVLTAANVVIIMFLIPMIGVGLYREKQWKTFRLYSIITVLIMVIFGSFTPVLMMNNIELLGLFERITIYSYQLWIFTLAILFIRNSSHSARLT